jgi:hypothetical protein
MYGNRSCEVRDSWCYSEGSIMYGNRSCEVRDSWCYSEGSVMYGNRSCGLCVEGCSIHQESGRTQTVCTNGALARNSVTDCSPCYLAERLRSALSRYLFTTRDWCGVH